MAQEPQGRPQPLRLQADFNRLRNEEQALRNKMNAGDTNAGAALEAKQREVLEFILAYKESLNG
jgi:hypothetical protein